MHAKLKISVFFTVQVYYYIEIDHILNCWAIMEFVPVVTKNKNINITPVNKTLKSLKIFLNFDKIKS